MLVPIFGGLYLFWLWVTRAPGLPIPPFWSRSKLVACGIFLGVYIPFALLVPDKEFNYWGEVVTEYGHWSLLIILFPELNRMFVSRMTIDSMTTLEATRGFGWALFSIWSIVSIAIVIGFAF